MNIKNITKTACLAVTGLLALASCSEEEFMTYEGNRAGIYLQRVSTTDINGTPLGFTDSLTISFASYAATYKEYPVVVPVCIMGDVVDYDRPFKMEVDKEKTTAIEGEEYEFSDTACYIPAGKTKQNVKLILKRSDRIAKETARLVFSIKDNENFTVELESYKNVTDWKTQGKELCGTSYKIIFSDKYAVTTWWELYGQTFYGTWSVRKEKLLNEIMGWTHADWERWKVAYGQMGFGAKKFRKHLQEQADNGTPVKEEDGSFMQLMPPYQVDYSKYE